MSATSVTERKLTVKSILEAKNPTESNAVNALGQTAMDAGLGLVVGGALSALIGKPSFYIGLVATGIAYYSGYKALAPIGIGMSATSLCVEGDTVTDRFKSIGKAFMSRTYADKVIDKVKASRQAAPDTTETTKGFGALPTANLDEIEQQIAAQAAAFQRQQQQSTNGVTGMYDEPDTSAF